MHTIQQLQSGALAGASYIKISENLVNIPSELYEYADTLEVLDLSGNELTALPGAFACFTNLRILFLSNNRFELFPAVLAALPKLDIVGFKANRIKEIPEQVLPVSLRWLILTDNKIGALPDSIGRCVKLQKVMLAGNKLSSLPDSMALCKKIQLLRISANNIQVLPGWLLSLPELAWLAYAGNPCAAQAAGYKNQPAEIDWNEIAIKEQLGEGASGNIYKAVIRASGSEIAVKIFKGAVTSDGLPQDEMNACIQAGLHPNMVRVKAVLAGHPEQKNGLVMDLIPPDYRNLGLPPDFVTCTRDTFTAGQTFTDKAVFLIVQGIAAVAHQLHGKGIMHGDLYAHNILVNAANHPLFGDFGAATMFSLSDTVLAPRLEKIEVRAYGYLIADLLERIADRGAQTGMLENLKNQCLREDPEQRPTFKSILDILNTKISK